MLERRTISGGITVLLSAALRPHGFVVAFTERSPGAGTVGNGDLDLSLRGGSDPAGAVGNRRALCRALGVRSFAFGEQVHGAGCIEIDGSRSGAGFQDLASAIPAADALVTETPNLPLAVLTADCVPLALADPGRGRIAVVHAGWRGISTGVIGAAIDRFPDPSVVMAVIGPAVEPDHYEVGEEVVAAVARAAPGVAVRRAGGRPRLDLPATVAEMLEGAGVRVVERARVCTACEPTRFFSHRRDGPTGRQALVAFRR
jgi:polyphenol oxidase